MAKKNHIQSIEEKIQKLQQEKEQFLEKQLTKIGKHARKTWGVEVTSSEHVFTIIENLKDEAIRQFDLLENADSKENTSENKSDDAAN